MQPDGSDQVKLFLSLIDIDYRGTSGGSGRGATSRFSPGDSSECSDFARGFGEQMPSSREVTSRFLPFGAGEVTSDMKAWIYFIVQLSAASTVT